MRYVTIDIDGTPHVAIQDPTGALELTAGGSGRSLSELLVLDEATRDRALTASGERAPDSARLLAPIRPATIVAIGLNYLDHIREAKMDRPERPLIFSKLRSSVIGPGDAIRIPTDLTQQVDWEVELAIVIGRVTRAVGPEAALDHIFGCTGANDVSARDLQFADGQWIRGKSLDTFCPLGPAVVTLDELGDPQAIGLTTRVNGTLMQDSTTAEMLFGVSELIAECSRAFTLYPGDVILTGTPWGCGAFMDPPRFLTAGDVVETAVEGIGTLRNPVVACSG